MTWVRGSVGRGTFLCALLCAGLTTGCYTVPETGRRSFNVVSTSHENRMGAEAFREMKKKGTLATNKVQVDRVRRVGRRIAEVVGDDLPGAEWEFVVFDSPDVNAFALPGGKVGVYSGLLEVAESDAELATVMGHEIAHVTARHGSERMSQNILVAAGAVGVGIAMQDESSAERNAALAAYGLGASIGVMLPYSRRHETEADIIGLRYAARAGYDPRAAIEFWSRMAKNSKSGSRPPEFLSTHPADATRIRHLEEEIPAALEIYESRDMARQTVDP